MSSEASIQAVSPRRQRTRDRLIAAARETIAQKGFQAATLDEIAARAGLTKGAIYGNFENRDELFIALAQTYWAPIKPRVKPGATLTDILRAMADATIEAIPDRASVAVGRLTGIAYTLTHEEHRARVAAVTADSLLVVATDVVQAANDKQQLEPMLGKLTGLPADLGRPETMLGDNGYCSAANVAACAAAGIAPLLALGRTPHHPSLDARFAAPPPTPDTIDASRNSGMLPIEPEKYTAYWARPSTPHTMIVISIARLRKWRAGSSNGLPDTEPRSFKNASTEPVVVIEPMITSM